MMSEKRFEWIDKDTISDNQTDEWYCFLFDDIRDDFVDFLNELNDENDILKQQLQTRYIVNKQYEELQRLKKENEQLQKETVFLAYWKRKAMILLMQVRRLTPRMTDEEVMEFSKELEDE